MIVCNPSAGIWRQVWVFLVACSLAFGSSCGPAHAQVEGVGLAAPEGFKVSLYADDDLAHNIFSMAIDARGRVIVAGPNYIKTLYDDNDDGRADRAELFSELPASGAHGLYAEGDSLWCTGDDGVWRFRDADGNGAADGPGERLLALRHPEHGANGLVKGPDGWLYIICGNDSGLSTAHVTTSQSPIEDPRCGGVVRLAPDGGFSDVVIDGFRNPYDLDFGPGGTLWTVDSDNERESALPWYAPTRLFDGATGRSHGWLLGGFSKSWNRPPWFFDGADRACEIGRGSPTGLVVYRHTQFPPEYRGAVLSACWTFGRVYALYPTPAEGSQRARVEVFLQTTGNVGFAPVDLAIGQDGSLFAAIGGRGTRGGVFRVKYEGPAEVTSEESHASTLESVLRASQPLAGWSRANWLPLAQELGAEPFAKVLADEQAPDDDRIRAAEVLVEVFHQIPLSVLESAASSSSEAVAARAAWCLGRLPPSTEHAQLVAQLTQHRSPFVLRSAWEAWSWVVDESQVQPDWRTGLTHDLPRVRSAARAAARGESRGAALAALTDASDWRSAAARCMLGAEGEDAQHDLLQLAETFGGTWPEEFALADGAWPETIVRLWQLHFGDFAQQTDLPELYAGYASEFRGPLGTWEANGLGLLLQSYPTDDAQVNQELARLAAQTQFAHAGLEQALAADAANIELPPAERLHYLICLSRLPNNAPTSPAVAQAVLELTLTATWPIEPDRNWPLRLSELVQALAAREPAVAEVLANAQELNSPDHALVVLALPDGARQTAARRLFALAQDWDEESWTSTLVRAIACLPADEILPELRYRWEGLAVRDAIAEYLAEQAHEDDRDRLIESLHSAQPSIVREAAQALVRLDSATNPKAAAAALQMLKQYCAAQEPADVRAALVQLLLHWSQAEVAEDETAVDLTARVYAPWRAWFEERYPKHVHLLAGTSSSDWPRWQERLAAIDWNAGDAARGKALFQRRACHRCHEGAGRLGPDLLGVGGRLSREDLVRAIVDPSRDVAPLYQTSLVITQDGLSHQGLLVYDSAEAILLQTAPDATVRIVGTEIAQVVPSRQSLMPLGLLNDLFNEDVADLVAYLQSLRKDDP